MKFNKKQNLETENLAGGLSFSESPKLEFVALLLTTFLKDQFYRTEAQTVTRMEGLLMAFEHGTFSFPCRRTRL